MSQIYTLHYTISAKKENYKEVYIIKLVTHKFKMTSRQEFLV